MTFTPETKAALAAKLDASNVKQREQGGRKVSYVEGWHAIAEANRIFGFDGWNRETIETKETNRDLVSLKGNNGDYQQWRVGYVCKVRVTVGSVIREGTGYGSGMGKPEALGDAVESAIKEAETDAMKRALMTFGNPFGLALYDKTQENVEKAEPARAAPKATPPAKTLAAKPAEPPQTKADAFWSAFWQRPSYELKGANITDPLAFGKAFEEACARAPSLDNLLKLEDDNLTDLAALNNQSPHASKQARAAFGAAQLHLTNKAA